MECATRETPRTGRNVPHDGSLIHEPRLLVERCLEQEESKSGNGGEAQRSNLDAGTGAGDDVAAAGVVGAPGSGASWGVRGRAGFALGEVGVALGEVGVSAGTALVVLVLAAGTVWRRRGAAVATVASVAAVATVSSVAAVATIASVASSQLTIADSAVRVPRRDALLPLGLAAVVDRGRRRSGWVRRAGVAAVATVAAVAAIASEQLGIAGGAVRVTRRDTLLPLLLAAATGRRAWSWGRLAASGALGDGGGLGVDVGLHDAAVGRVGRRRALS